MENRRVSARPTFHGRAGVISAVKLRAESDTRCHGVTDTISVLFRAN